MGDRGNIVIRYGTGTEQKDVYFYTHWNGSDIGSVLQAALSKKWRWEDDAYLARIIFCELVKGSEADETGFGISPFMCDNEHDILVVNTAEQKVEQYSVRCEDKLAEKPSKTWTFEEFVKLEHPVEV